MDSEERGNAILLDTGRCSVSAVSG
jgi:hypothetical protein